MFLSTRFGHKIVLLEATLYRRAIENNYVEAGYRISFYNCGYSSSKMASIKGFPSRHSATVEITAFFDRRIIES